MKLTAFFILATALQVSAKGYSQERVSVNFENTRLDKALKVVEKKSSFHFVYSNLVLTDKNKITLRANDIIVEDLLGKLLQNTGLTFSVMDNNLVVIKEAINPIDIIVKGRITDSKGEPLEGVSVKVVSKNIGTATNAKGEFTLTVSDNDKLEFSFVGFETQTIDVNGRKQINLVMVESISQLNDVVVIGYGTQTRKNLTSAISTLKTSDVVSLPYANLVDAVAGRVPGIFLQSAGGEPGSVSKIVIRGGSGPDQGEPLFVIDNVISSKYDFQNLQPQDISDVSFLKDGASTAIYGTQGANGVVLVKTKRGVSGTPHINFSVLQEFSTPTVIPQLINSYQFATAENEVAMMDGLPPIFSSGILDTIKNKKDLIHYPDNNWYDLTMRKYTPQTKYSIYMNGGNDKTTYFLSLSAFNQGSMYKTNATNFERYNFRSNINQKFQKQGITLDANFYGTFTNNNYASSSPFEIFSHITSGSSPLKPAYNPDGTYAAGVDLPLVDIDPRSGYTKDRTRNANANVTLTWDVPWVKGLQATVLGYSKIENDFGKIWHTYAPQYNPDGSLAIPFSPPSINESISRYWNYTLQTRIEYKRMFGKHSINLLGLYEQFEDYDDSLSAGRVNYLSNAVDQLFAGSPTGLTNNGSAAESGNEAFAGRVSYNYASKYLLEGSFRYNGSDDFISSKRWGFFPSLSAGWALSEEKFFQNFISSKIINYLKLRASIGTTGNLPTSRFPYLSTYNLVNNSYVVGGNLVNGFNDGGLVNPTAVSWYTTKDFDLGGDFSLLNSHINGSIDYFYKRTTGFTVSPSAGYITPLGTGLPIIVSGSAFRSAGWDFSLAYKNNVGKFTYEVNGNLSLYDQLWERNDNEDNVTLKNPLTRTTQETNYWGSAYINEGYYQSVNQIINNPRSISSNNSTPGDLEYEDVNGDGKIDNNDLVRLGKSQFPHLTYGINFSFGYKALSMQMLWQGVGSRDIYVGSSIQASGANVIRNEYQLNFWTPDNTNAAFPRQSTDGNRNGENNYVTSNFWLVNAKYLRLKSLMIALDVKKQFPKQLSFLNFCIINLSGINLLTFSPIMKYFDPENSDPNNYGYPMSKTYSIGVNIGL